MGRKRKKFLNKKAQQNGRPSESLDGLPPIPTKAELEAAGIKIVVGIPMPGYITDFAFVHFVEIFRKGWPNIDHLYGRVDSNRNRMAKALLEKTDATHILMLDADHLHPPDVVEHLARWVLDDPGRKIVGGLHFRRGAPYEPCAFVYGADGDLHAATEWDQGLVEVHAIGHGSILIAREVFETMEKPYWAYTYNHADRDIYPSEDMYFSFNARQAGFKMYCDTTQTSPHMIHGLVDEQVFRQWLSDNPEKIMRIKHQREKEAVLGD